MKRPYTGESWTRFKELMQNLIKRTAIVETRAQNNEDDIVELQPKVTSLQTKVEEKNPVFSQAPSPTVYNWDSKENKYVESGGDSIALNCAPYNKKGYWRFYGSSYMSALQDKPETKNPTGNYAYMYTIQPLDNMSAIQVFKYYSTGSSYENHIYVRDMGNINSNPPTQSTGWVKYTNSTDFPFNAEIGGTGWEHGLNSGINLVPGTSDEWSEWITPEINKANSVISPMFFASGNLLRKLGDVYTNYVEVEFENVTATPGQNFMFRPANACTLTDVSGWQYNLSNPWGSKILLTSPPENKVYKFVFHSTMTSTDYIAENLNYWILGFRCDYWASGRYRYRCVKMERGHVDYPQWSPAPEDITAINDITTMPNLLRGTRDFTRGTISDSTLSGVMLDGFNNGSGTANRSTWIDENGFTVYRITASGNSTDTYANIGSSSVHGLKNGDKFTVSVDFMIEDLQAYTDGDVITVRYYGNNSSTVKYKTFRASAVSSDLQSGKWYTAVFHFEFNDLSPEPGRFYVSFNLTRNGAINFRKPGVYPGHVLHPGWSSNPFDYASSYDFTSLINSAPLLLGNISSRINLNTDLNDYIVPGMYSISYTDATKNTVLNMPVKDGGTLIVTRTNGGATSLLRQIFTIQSEPATEYIRFTSDNGATWSDWRQTYANTTVRPIAGGGTGRNDGLTVGIAGKGFVSNEDLNQKLTSERYYSGTTAITQTLKGIPVTANHCEMDVIPYANSGGEGSGAAFQIFNATYDDAYFRTFGRLVKPSKASSWFEYLTTIMNPYNPGTYVGQSIATRFANEIGSNHIANWLSSRVSQGNFEGLNIGDYVDIPCTGVSRRYVIAAIDPYYQQSQSRMKHHIVMVPNTGWKLDPNRDGSYSMGNDNAYILWNTTADNNGTATEQAPYLVSNLHKWESEVALKQFPQQWQDVMIDRWVYSEIRYSASSKLSNPTGAKWANLGKLWSLSEVEINGRPVRSSSKYGSNLTDVQFPIFKTRTKMLIMSGMTSVWLRDVEDGSSSNCCMFSFIADSSSMASNYSGGLCTYPCFLLG